jgi:hypothetical protein
MRLRTFFLAALLAFAASDPTSSRAGNREGCPVTEPPNPPFIPPRPYRANAGQREFLYGTPSLWTRVYPGWKVGGPAGSKLPYFSQGFDSRNERSPDLNIVARRLDGPEPPIHANHANGASIDGTVAGMFMVTGLSIPTSGCWEISARYGSAPGAVRSLTYTVWVEP